MSPVESLPPVDSAPTPAAPTIGYVLKMYPRFSETFVVSEILAREARGEKVVVFSLRPPTDPRFHPELARVEAPVVYVERPHSAVGLWRILSEDLGPGSTSGIDPAAASAALPDLLSASHDDAVQAVRLARLAREYGVDHLHAHFASMATVITRLAAGLTSLPFSFTAHAKDIFQADVDHTAVRAALLEAHHAVTISGYNLEHMRANYGKEACARLHLVRNGLELSRFPFVERTAHEGPARLLAVGRLVEKKGFGHLVRTVAQLRDAGIDVVCDLVGDGPEKEGLAAAIVAHEVSDRVRLCGPRTQEEVRAMLTDHDLFVAPFVVAADGNADGLPTVLLEAMASGIPCVAGDVTAVGEVVRAGETGWLVDPAAGLTPAVREALAAPGLARRYARAARALVVREYDSRLQARSLAALVAGESASSHAPALSHAPAPMEVPA